MLGARSARVDTVVRVVGLGLLLWGVSNQVRTNLSGGDWAIPLLASLAVVGWLGWTASRWFDWPAPLTLSFLGLFAVAGGLLAPYAPSAIIFPAVATLGTAVAFELPAALAMAGAGMAAVILSLQVVESPSSSSVLAGGALAIAACLLAGTSRHQYVVRAEEAEQLLAERVRADAERDRAAALAERNRMGREVHDVLAHSLGALSVQLDAADAVLEGGGGVRQARELVRKARRLAVEGLDETRQAVYALRDEPVQLAEQLTALAEREGAAITVGGKPHRLEPHSGVALYRAAQEALTNARKHAPGAPVTIDLEFGAEQTVLEVVNGRGTEGPASRLEETGGGFGLQGMRERIELLGGEVSAMPKNGGWTVHVRVPA
jgi:signal transduction histidine kinase